MSIKKLTLAVLTSSAAIVPLYLLIALFSGDFDNMLLLIALVASLVVSTVGIVVVGIPTHFILVWIGRARAIYYVMIGFMVPSSIAAVVQPFGQDGFQWILVQSIILGMFGAVIAFIFWKVMNYESNT